MLVLTRNIRERIKIGQNITITIIEVNGKQVKIGIEAPNDVEVHREEIFNRILRDKTIKLIKEYEDKDKKNESHLKLIKD